MTDEKRIILPGDPGWDKPRAEEVAPELKVPVPGEALEEVFRGVVEEVQATIEVAPEQVPASVEAVPAKPGPSYKFHKPSQQKVFRIPVPKPIDAELLEDLPRSWEQKCLVGGIDYVAVEGQAFKQRVRRSGFRQGDHITLTEMVFFPGTGALYGFKEGNRGGYGVRPDQVSFKMPTPDPTPVVDVQEVKTPLEEQSNGDPGRQAD